MSKLLCAIPDCDKPHYAKGYCRNHSYRLRVHGDPLGGKAARGEPLQWLREHVQYDGSDCLLWPFTRTSKGLPSIVLDGVTMNAARVMCMEAHGEPPEDMPLAIHTRRNCKQACVHPGHLRWGTRSDKRYTKSKRKTSEDA
jgi:hypothetical protein